MTTINETTEPNQTTTQKHLAKLQAEQHESRPVWIRPPRAGQQEHYTGLTRSKLYELAQLGHIKTLCLKRPDQIRGCRLFNLPSLLQFIQCQYEAAEATESQDGGHEI